MSFTPLEPASTPPPPAAPKTPTETVTLPRATKVEKQPVTLNTVPAGSVPAPQATANQPYNNLRNRSFPDFSVNKQRALTPEELAAQQAESKTIEKVDLDGIDLANDIGQPVDPNRRTPPVARGGGGS